MGYFGAAFLLTRQPDWNRLLDLPFGFRGYEYRNDNRQLWFLDFWHPANRAPQWPFTGAQTADEGVELAGDDVTGTFDRICAEIAAEGESPMTYGGGWLRLLLAVANRLEQGTFFFVADDEWYDMAAFAAPKGIRRVACQMDAYDVRYSEGVWTVTPQSEPDDEAYWSEAALDKLKSIDQVRVMKPVEIESRSYLGNATTEWPKEAGDPSDILPGWDAFLTLGRDSTMVFEKLA